jgi:hypothetical protein
MDILNGRVGVEENEHEASRFRHRQPQFLARPGRADLILASFHRAQIWTIPARWLNTVGE